MNVKRTLAEQIALTATMIKEAHTAVDGGMVLADEMHLDQLDALEKRVTGLKYCIHSQINKRLKKV